MREWSNYQKAVFDFVQNTKDSAVINAVAGSGKTTVIVEASKIATKFGSTLFLAFNRAIAQELGERMKGTSVECMTLHSHGLRAIKKKFNFNGVTIDERKWNKYIDENDDELLGDMFFETDTERTEYIRDIVKLLNLARINLVRMDESSKCYELSDIVEHHNLDIEDMQMQIVNKLLGECYKVDSVVDFTDMITLPLNESMKRFIPKYDTVFIDESQDLSKAQRELMLASIKPNGRFIGVGDKKQCQPAGTKVTLSDGSEKNIEDIKVGDVVVSYATGKKCCFQSYYKDFSQIKTDLYGTHVTAVEHHPTNKLIEVKTETGRKTMYTPDHICYVRWNRLSCDGKYILYLMKNENGMWRIGKSKIYKKSIQRQSNKENPFGLQNRMCAEKCSEAWILDVYDNEFDARRAEVVNSMIFQIPQIVFSQQRTMSNFFGDKDIIGIYDELRRNYDMEEKAKLLLEKFGRDIRFPIRLLNKSTYQSSVGVFEIRACNLIPNVMDFLVFDKENIIERTHGKSKKPSLIVGSKHEKIVSVESKHGDFEVYSMNVEKNHNYVGDGILTHNCINGFAGSDIEGFNTLIELAHHELPLSICYRCGKRIITEAQSIIPYIEPFDKQIDGEVVHQRNLRGLENGDMVICRKSAPLVSVCLKLIANGRSAQVKGRDIADGLKSIVKKAKTNDIEKMLDKIQREITKVANRLNRVGYDGKLEEQPQYINIVDKIECIQAISDSCEDVEELMQKLDTLFTDTKSGNVITLSTIHKAKGLEADNVYILLPDCLPMRYKGQQPWEFEQEMNLKYVAITRAKKRLVWVDLTQLELAKVEI